MDTPENAQDALQPSETLKPAATEAAKPKAGRAKASAKPAAAEEVVEEQPTMGGSYIRNPDGTLERVEFTREHDEADEAAAEEEEAGDANEDESQED